MTKTFNIEIEEDVLNEAMRRKGDPGVSERVRALLSRGEAGWCQMVRLELWRGANNDWDKQLLEHLESQVKMLALSMPVWDRAVQFSRN